VWRLSRARDDFLTLKNTLLGRNVVRVVDVALCAYLFSFFFFGLCCGGSLSPGGLGGGGLEYSMDFGT